MGGVYLLDYLIRSSNRAYVERFQWTRWPERRRRWLWNKGRVCTLWSTSNPRLSRQGSPVKARSSSSHSCYRLRRGWKKIRRESEGERERKREDQTSPRFLLPLFPLDEKMKENSGVAKTTCITHHSSRKICRVNFYERLILPFFVYLLFFLEIWNKLYNYSKLRFNETFHTFNLVYYFFFVAFSKRKKARS